MMISKRIKQLAMPLAALVCAIGFAQVQAAEVRKFFARSYDGDQMAVDLDDMSLPASVVMPTHTPWTKPIKDTFGKPVYE